jgi:hypothetical protein
LLDESLPRKLKMCFPGGMRFSLSGTRAGWDRKTVHY